MPHDEESRLIQNKEGHRVEPAGEVQERETPAHLEVHKNGRVGEETAHLVGSETY